MRDKTMDDEDVDRADCGMEFKAGWVRVVIRDDFGSCRTNEGGWEIIVSPELARDAIVRDKDTARVRMVEARAHICKLMEDLEIVQGMMARALGEDDEDEDEDDGAMVPVPRALLLDLRDSWEGGDLAGVVREILAYVEDQD